MPQLVFIEQFYYPEGWGGAQLPRDVTTHLAGAGFDVEVICGGDQYAETEDESMDDPRDAGVRIKRTWRLLGGDIQTAKLFRQLWFYLAAFPLLLFRRSPAIFVMQTNPPLVVPMVALAALIHRRPFIIIAQDLYPEVVFAHGMMRRDSMVGKILLGVFRWAYARARRVVSLGPIMSERLIGKGVLNDRIAYISNWSTGDQQIVRSSDNRLRSEWGLDNKFVLLYSGNLGISHDIETPILAMQELSQEFADIRLVFVGKGSRLAEAKALAKKAEVEHVVLFKSFVPFDQLPHSLGVACAALVTLREEFEGLVVPSKCLGYLARAIPTVYIGPRSDVQELITTSGGGVCCAPGDVGALASEVRRLIADQELLRNLGNSGKKFYDEFLARPIGLKGYLNLVEGVVKPSGHSPEH